MPRRYTRRLHRIGQSVRRHWKVISVSLLLSVALWIIEQFVANAVTGWVYSQIPPLYAAVASAVEWSANHPGHLSAIAFFIVLIAVLGLSYWETRPPSGIALIVAPRRDSRNDLGIYEGVRIINNTGGDLLNCWVDAIEWDAEPEFLRRRIRWEVAHDKLDIADGEGKSAYFVYRWNGTMRATIGEMHGPQLPEGETEIGLSFHANKMEGGTHTIPFWADVDVQLVDNRHEITILEVTP